MAWASTSPRALAERLLPPTSATALSSQQSFQYSSSADLEGSRSGRPGGCGLHDAHRAGSWDSPDPLEPCTVEKVGQLRLGPFLTSSGCKHEDVKDMTACVGLVVGENVLNDEHLGFASRGPSDGAEDRSALLIGQSWSTSMSR